MRHIRLAITEDMAQDSAIPTLFRLACDQKNVSRLQRVHNAAARVVVWSYRRRSTNSSALRTNSCTGGLHIEWRINFNIITYNTYLLPSLLTSIHCWNIAFHLALWLRSAD